MKITLKETSKEVNALLWKVKDGDEFILRIFNKNSYKSPIRVLQKSHLINNENFLNTKLKDFKTFPLMFNDSF